MSDEYLWDRSGTPDPEVQQLEEILRPLAHRGGAFRSPATPRAPVRSRVRRHAVAGALALAASLLVAVAVAHWWRSQPEGRSGSGWAVARVEGAPTLGSRPMDERDELTADRALVTDGAAKARIEVPGMGVVDVDRRSRVELVPVDGRPPRLRLPYGTLHAQINAPPGRFIVETPSATAVDLGCAYTLHVDEDGAGEVAVTFGWISLEWRGRESFVPAGAMCRTRPQLGPGTPHHTHVSAEYRAALDVLDFADGTATDRSAALDRVLRESRAVDVLTLWHLLARAMPLERGSVFDRLAQLIPPPPSVTREGIVAGDRTMLDRWGAELGFGEVLSVRGERRR